MVAHSFNILSLNISTVLRMYLDGNISNCFMHFWFDVQVFLLFGGFVGLMWMCTVVLRTSWFDVKAPAVLSTS